MLDAMFGLSGFTSTVRLRDQSLTFQEGGDYTFIFPGSCRASNTSMMRTTSPTTR